VSIYIGLARTVYIRRIWLYIWWFPSQKSIYTVHRIYMVLANPTYIRCTYGIVSSKSTIDMVTIYGVKHKVPCHSPHLAHQKVSLLFQCLWSGTVCGSLSPLTVPGPICDPPDPHWCSSLCWLLQYWVSEWLLHCCGRKFRTLCWILDSLFTQWVVFWLSL